MSWILGIDTSSVELGVGLVNEGRPVAGFSRYVRGSHAEHIARAVEFILAVNGVDVARIGRIAVAVGPGSFTGLRIGIAFVKGFCCERAVRVLPVSSLESVAAAWQGAGESVVVAFDARRDEVFWARFERRGPDVKRLCEDTVTTVARFSSSVGPRDTVVTDTMGYARSTAFDGLAARAGVHRVEEVALQRGLACAGMASLIPNDSPRWAPAESIEPRYLSHPHQQNSIAGGVSGSANGEKTAK